MLDINLTKLTEELDALSLGGSGLFTVRIEGDDNLYVKEGTSSVYLDSGAVENIWEKNKYKGEKYQVLAKSIYNRIDIYQKKRFEGIY